MPAVTDSSNQLTYFANCYTIGLLEITYPSGRENARHLPSSRVLASPDNSSGTLMTMAQGGVQRTHQAWTRLRKCKFQTELSDVTSYSEPAVLWRLRHPQGDQARATLIPGSPESTLVFFVNDRFDRGENFAEWAEAMARADAVRKDLLERGWETVT